MFFIKFQGENPLDCYTPVGHQPRYICLGQFPTLTMSTIWVILIDRKRMSVVPTKTSQDCRASLIAIRFTLLTEKHKSFKKRPFYDKNKRIRNLFFYDKNPPTAKWQ